MFRLISISMAAFLLVAGSASAQMRADDIINRPDLKDLSDQDVKPDTDLIKALHEAALVPAKFVASIESIDLETLVKQDVGETFQLRNTGGREAEVHSINTVGNFPGLDLKHDCEEIMDPGAYCTISVSYSSDKPINLTSAIVISVTANNQSEVNIPFKISVKMPPRKVEVVTPSVVVKPREDTTPKIVGPTKQQIAQNYFSQMGGMMNSSRTGIIVVKGPEIAKNAKFAGASYDDMRVETVYQDERYDKDIPYTDASLKVNRDKILTADRVIKAVLETPVSNIICGKTVAHVESDVYSATSKVPLIPAGSRVIGKCGSFINERVGIEWTRIITTDGRSITFDLPADTRDAMGYGGALGRINQPAFDRYVLPIISTMIDSAAGVVTAVYGEDEDVVTDDNGNITSSTSAKNEGLRIITEDARGTAQDIIKDIRDVRKIAVIPAGSRIDIEIGEDVYFTDSRKVVRLADMKFGLDEIDQGNAKRDLPENIVLKPAPADYKGPTIKVDGRYYMLEKQEIPIQGNGQGSQQVSTGVTSGQQGQVKKSELTLDQAVAGNTLATNQSGVK